MRTATSTGWHFARPGLAESHLRTLGLGDRVAHQTPHGEDRISHERFVPGGTRERLRQIEEIHRLGLIRVADDGLGMLLRSKLGITISRGWPSRLLVVLLGNKILPISEARLLLKIQSVTSNRKSRCGLSQRHSL
jgi:hypothetical protein